MHALIRYTVLAMALGLGAAQAEDVQRIDVKMSNYRFEPDVITVKKGTPVELHFKNESALSPHEFVIDDPAMPLEIEVEPYASETLSFTPTQEGEFKFSCNKKLLFMKSHDRRGMHGVLKVE